MCQNPTYIKNPYYRADQKSEKSFATKLLHNTEDKYIACPCGHCLDCISQKQGSLVQRMECESEFNHFFFATLTYDNKHLPHFRMEVPNEFLRPATRPETELTGEIALEVTASLQIHRPDHSVGLTGLSLVQDYQHDALEEFVDSCEDFKEFSSMRGYTQVTGEDTTIFDIPFADIRHLQLMFKRMRDNNTLGRPFRYLACSERGTKHGRPHFHILFLVPKHDKDDINTCNTLNAALSDMLLRYWSTNIGTRKNPVYERNFTYKQRFIGNRLYRNFDCHYVNPVLTTEGVADVVYYVTKYMFKQSKKEDALRRLLFARFKEKDSFKSVWDVVKSRMMCSKGIGVDGWLETEVVPEVSVITSLPDTSGDMPAWMLCEDLPSDDMMLPEQVETYHIVTYRKTRKLHKNQSIIDKIDSQCLKLNEKGIASYVSYNGKILPLCGYLRKHCVSESSLVDIYYSWNPVDFPRSEPDPDTAAKKAKQLAKSRKLACSHEYFESCLDEVENTGYSVDPYDKYRSLSKLINNVSSKVFLGK